MRKLIYAMQFEGQATPANSAGTVMKATTRAASCSITSTVGENGLAGQITPTAGGAVTFESEVSFTGENSLVEHGTIHFGRAGVIHFSTVGEGYLGTCADPALKHGCISWKIDSGEGQFDGASGLITSNFVVTETGAVTDNHFGVIFVR